MSSKKLKTDYVASIIYIAGGKNLKKKTKKKQLPRKIMHLAVLLLLQFLPRDAL